MHTHLLGVLKGGHWPTLMGAWLHLTLSFMVWLLIGALGVPIATTFGLSATETVTALAVPLLGGALLRVMGGWSCDWFGAQAYRCCGTTMRIGRRDMGMAGYSVVCRAAPRGICAGDRRRKFCRGAAAGGASVSTGSSGAMCSG